MKKFDFEILTCLYVLKSEFIYDTFTVMYVCAYVSKHDNVQTVYSTELKFGMNIAHHRRTNPIDLGECRQDKSTRKNSYALRPVESNS